MNNQTVNHILTYQMIQNKLASVPIALVNSRYPCAELDLLQTSQAATGYSSQRYHVDVSLERKITAIDGQRICFHIRQKKKQGFFVLKCVVVLYKIQNKFSFLTIVFSMFFRICHILEQTKEPHVVRTMLISMPICIKRNHFAFSLFLV